MPCLQVMGMVLQFHYPSKLLSNNSVSPVLSILCNPATELLNPNETPAGSISRGYWQASSHQPASHGRLTMVIALCSRSKGLYSVRGSDISHLHWLLHSTSLLVWIHSPSNGLSAARQSLCRTPHNVPQPCSCCTSASPQARRQPPLYSRAAGNVQSGGQNSSP